jgi:hypothetical protein
LSDKGSNEGYNDDWTNSDDESLIKFDNEDFDLLVAEVEGLAVPFPYNQLLERKTSKQWKSSISGTGKDIVSPICFLQQWMCVNIIFQG